MIEKVMIQLGPKKNKAAAGLGGGGAARPPHDDRKIRGKESKKETRPSQETIDRVRKHESRNGQGQVKKRLEASQE